MFNLDFVLRLYANVLHNDIVINAIPDSEIRAGIQSMTHAYLPDTLNFESAVIEFPNFNDVACRCAFLHKYAPLHTYIVFDAVLKILKQELSLFREFVVNKQFKFCSLGGGPGSDVIGVLAALKVVFSSFSSSVTVIDCMENWALTFKSVLQELKFGGYGTEWYNDDFHWNYIGANLLCSMTNEVNTSIGSASLITMVKFISASKCTNTEEMIDKIFRVMKPGALVLFIDNAAGGFTQLIERSSRKNGLFNVFGPLRHVAYEAEALKVDRFGYTSCFKTTVTIILLKKSLNPQQIRKYARSTPDYLNQNVVSPKPPESLNFVVMDASKISKANINNSAHSSSGHSSNMKNALLPTPTNLNLNLQKSNSTFKHNEVGVTKNNYDSTRSPEYSSNINKLPTKVDNLKSNVQKPSAAVGQKTGDVTSARPKSSPSSGCGSLNTKTSQATLANVNHSLKTRSPEYSSNINKLPTKVDNLKSNVQKPSAAVGQKTGDVISARPKSSPSSGCGSLNTKASQATRANVNHSLNKDNSNAAFDQKKSNVASTIAPKICAIPAGYIRHPHSESYVAPNTQPATAPDFYYRPVPPQETEDDAEETCCTCCVVS